MRTKTPHQLVYEIEKKISEPQDGLSERLAFYKDYAAWLENRLTDSMLKETYKV